MSITDLCTCCSLVKQLGKSGLIFKSACGPKWKFPLILTCGMIKYINFYVRTMLDTGYWCPIPPWSMTLMLTWIVFWMCSMIQLVSFYICTNNPHSSRNHCDLKYTTMWSQLLIMCVSDIYWETQQNFPWFWPAWWLKHARYFPTSLDNTNTISQGFVQSGWS